MKPRLPIAFDVPNETEPVEALKRCVEQLEKHGVSFVTWHSLYKGLIARAYILTPQRKATYLKLVDCLVRINKWSLERWPFPSLYDGFVSYEEEEPGKELFQSIPALFLIGSGDCEDLVAARLAEPDIDPKARAYIYETGKSPSGGRMLHLVIQHQNGIEDPSRMLGMR